MKLIVGLGNPGRKYQGTRHNIGFDVLDEAGRRYMAGPRKEKFKGEIAEVNLGGERGLLLWPLTFMNLSGTSVGKAVDFYKLEAADVLVVCDDFNLPLAKLRFRARGSSGGQKGLGDIIRRLGSEDVGRLRIGIGETPPHWDPADFVLSKFGADEGEAVEQMVRQAAASIGDWAVHGVEFCMNEYN